MSVVRVRDLTKLVLNVYRNWVGEHAVVRLHKHFDPSNDSSSAAAIAGQTTPCPEYKPGLQIDAGVPTYRARPSLTPIPPNGQA